MFFYAQGWTNALTRGDFCCRTTALHENLVMRLKILADLHWSHQRPLSAAESRFISHVLPDLEDTATALQRDVRVRALASTTAKLFGCRCLCRLASARPTCYPAGHHQNVVGRTRLGRPSTIRAILWDCVDKFPGQRRPWRASVGHCSLSRRQLSVQAAARASR